MFFSPSFFQWPIQINYRILQSLSTTDNASSMQTSNLNQIVYVSQNHQKDTFQILILCNNTSGNFIYAKKWARTTSKIKKKLSYTHRCARVRIEQIKYVTKCLATERLMFVHWNLFCWTMFINYVCLCVWWHKANQRRRCDADVAFIFEINIENDKSHNAIMNETKRRWTCTGHIYVNKTMFSWVSPFKPIHFHSFAIVIIVIMMNSVRFSHWPEAFITWFMCTAQASQVKE